MKERTLNVLKHTIESHIDSAEAVGSKSLMDRFDCSSATLRKELNDLMQDGYLAQLHHSSGRVPTEKGYRYYIDHCLNQDKPNGLSSLSSVEGSKNQHQVPAVIQNLLALHTDTRELMVDVSHVLSKLCRTACLVVDTQVMKQSLSALHLVLIDVSRVLVVALGAMGVIKEDVIQIDEKIDALELERLSALFQKLVGPEGANSVADVDFAFIVKAFPKYREFINKLKQSLDQISQEAAADVHVTGVSSMLALPEFEKIDYARNMMTVLEDASFLSNVFERQLSVATTSTVVGELDSAETKLSETSLVYRHATSSQTSSTALAVLGPMRMNYSFVIPLIDSVVEMIENKCNQEGKHE